MQKKSSIFVIFVLLSLSACSLPGNTSPATPTASESAAASPDNTIRFTYGNISLVTPPFLSNKITAEALDLREQRDPGDVVPSVVEIDLRPPWDSSDENGLYSQVLVYPLADLISAYPQAVDEVKKLQSTLNQKGQDLPFWPRVYYPQVSGAELGSYGTPVLTAQSQLLDFGSGRGVRYLTLLVSQPPRPYPFEGLVYIYQGITDDGKYYISMILPIHVAGQDIASLDLEKLAEMPAPDYTSIAARLNALTPDQFDKSLGDFDGLVKSLVVGP